MAETTELATGDLMALLREASERITEVKRAFGAPGDYGYGTAEGNALYELYVFRSKLLNALRAPGTGGMG